MAGRFEGISDLEWRLFEDIFPPEPEKRDRVRAPFTISLCVKLSQEKVESLMNAMRRSAISLDRKVSSTTGNDTTDLIEMIASSNQELDIYYQSELSQLLLETLNILTEREKEAVILKHGLLDRNSKSLNAVSFELGITREGVRQCLSRAYRKLRSHKKSELFELFSLYVA